MHPRNPYQTPPDFKELALKYPEFRKHARQKLTGKIEIDFKDAAAVRSLTTVLLKRDFNLDVELPPDRLVPTLPLRLNYLLWIEDLLQIVKPVNDVKIHGIDIGTGACCIYPILAARKNNWHFTATEADEINHECSLKTLERNNLLEQVTLIKVVPESMLNGNIDTTLQYDFTMCNPPFFDSDSSGPKSRSEKRPPPMCPKSGGSTSSTEIAVKGGEVQFIKNLIRECQELKASVKIFTTMVGHKSSLAPIKVELKEVGASSSIETEFCQGRTTRWGLAWTFHESICLAKTAKARSKSNTKAPPPLSYIISRDCWKDKGDFTVGCIMNKITELLHFLKIEVRKVNRKKKDDGLDQSAVEFVSRENTWSNQRRKRREEKRAMNCHTHDGHATDSLPEMKRPKMDSEITDMQVIDKEDASKFCLKGLLLLEESSSDVITLLIQWIEGGLGRESMNQILQYMKNHLFDK